MSQILCHPFVGGTGVLPALCYLFCLPFLSFFARHPTFFLQKKIQWRKMPTNEYFEDLEGMSLKFLLVWLTLAIDLSTHNIIEKPLEIFF